MRKKEKFIKFIDELLQNNPNALDEDAMAFFLALKQQDEARADFTDKGKMILVFIQENKELYNNVFQAKTIGEGLGIPSRSISGSIRKLVSDGYVEKLGTNPSVYSLTQKGAEVRFDN